MPLAANEIEFEGKVYTMAEINGPELVHAVEDHYRATRLGPVEAILPELEKLKDFPVAQKHLVDLAYADLRSGAKAITAEERVKLGAWCDSREGISFLMWYQLKKNHPELTHLQVENMITLIGFDEAKKKRDAANAKMTAAILAAEKETAE